MNSFLDVNFFKKYGKFPILHGSTLPGWLAWMRYISLWFYSNEAFNINQWKDVDHIDCDRDEESECINSGQEVLDFYGFDEVGGAHTHLNSPFFFYDVLYTA